jgi:hypothetical protein
MKYNIEIEVVDADDNVTMTVPAKLLAGVLRSCARVLPKPLNLVSAASFGVVTILGPKTFFDVALGGIKQSVNHFLKGASSNARANKGTVGVDKKETGRGGL